MIKSMPLQKKKKEVLPLTLLMLNMKLAKGIMPTLIALVTLIM